MVEQVQIQELSVEAYQPIGDFVTYPGHTPTIQEDIVKYWANLAEFHIEGAIDIGWVTMVKRPLVITQMERHFMTTEIVIPLDEIVVPVAVGRSFGDPNALPRSEDVRGFYLRPGQMITYKPGSWHFGGFPVKGEEASFIVFCRKGTADEDVIMLDIEGVDEIRFTFKKEHR
jgi:ureidoglycolate hydrolase